LDAETGPKLALETADVHRDRKSGDDTAKPPQNGLFGVADEMRSWRLDGGVRSQLRTRLTLLFGDIRVIFEKNSDRRTKIPKRLQHGHS